MSEQQSAQRGAQGPAVWVSSLHTGGCAACAQSIAAALEAPPYARRLRTLGVTSARLPRHSDIILLCGALTEQARVALTPLIAGTPRPRALIAVGDCAINGCVFAGSAALTTPLAQALAVNVEIAGCPPTPQAIIEALAEAQRLLATQMTKTTRTIAAAPITLPTESPTASPSAAPSDERAARLTTLIQAASDGWDDEGDEDADEDTADDEMTAGAAPAAQAQTSNADDHTTEPSAGASASAGRHSRNHTIKHRRSANE